MIDNVVLRWIVTLLFALSIAGLVYLVVTTRHRWTALVGHLLHIVMCAAMLVMAWPAGARLPTVGPMVFFLLAAVWFSAMVFRADARLDRLVNVYHAFMMLAMAWMYAVMNGGILPGQSHPGAGGNGGTMPGMTMPGMNMPEPNTAPTGPTARAYPAWITVIDWIWTVGFALAAAAWLYLLVVQRHKTGHRAPDASLGPICQAMMAAGMAIMFAVML
ncbi:MAG TPA: DUF5134 domain-containing protein [Mycobacterium sp.]|nr:DUF5134 domain-containing protein [Mycobacterium sp.]